jgi:hypothetical protein
MEPSDLFWFLSIIGAYVGELAADEIPLTATIAVGSVLADLCRLAGVPAVREAEAVISNLDLFPLADGAALMG